jgi:hypothetical protein
MNLVNAFSAAMGMLICRPKTRRLRKKTRRSLRNTKRQWTTSSSSRVGGYSLSRRLLEKQSRDSLLFQSSRALSFDVIVHKWRVAIPVLVLGAGCLVCEKEGNLKRRAVDKENHRGKEKRPFVESRTIPQHRVKAHGHNAPNGIQPMSSFLTKPWTKCFGAGSQQPCGTARTPTPAKPEDSWTDIVPSPKSQADINKCKHRVNHILASSNSEAILDSLAHVYPDADTPEIARRYDSFSSNEPNPAL